MSGIMQLTLAVITKRVIFTARLTAILENADPGAINIQEIGSRSVPLISVEAAPNAISLIIPQKIVHAGAMTTLNFGPLNAISLLARDAKPV